MVIGAMTFHDRRPLLPHDNGTAGIWGDLEIELWFYHYWMGEHTGFARDSNGSVL